jgi:hypothetical protein
VIGNLVKDLSSNQYMKISSTLVISRIKSSVEDD